MKLIIAEKPSVARDLAQALGIKAQGRAYFRGTDYIITWAVGHLVTLAEPHQINPVWQKWRESDLPILPKHWPLNILENTAAQFSEIQSLMRLPEVKSLIAATDAGREGELIFRFIYEKAECAKPVERLWLSSLTPESIAAAFRTMRPLSDYDSLADNARGRSRSDWLVGLNFTRAYSLKNNDKWTVGRVQTPTLAMVVERTENILAFVPENYQELEAVFETKAGAHYKGLYGELRAKRNPVHDNSLKGEAKRFTPNDPDLETIRKRVATGSASVLKREDKQQKMAPPKFYDLTELQKDANRLYGFQAKVTLDIAQSLYESHKLITYPRSDSRYLSEAVAKSLPDVVKTIRGPYESAGLTARTGISALGKDYVDDAKVSDHHAIIPTGKDSERLRLTADERKVFDLIAKRLLMAWQEDHVKSQSIIHTVVHSLADGIAFEDSFRSSGSIVLEEGWRRLERKAPRPDALALPLVQVKEHVQVKSVAALKKETKPPAAFSDATLLNGMASAGSRLDDKELTDILRERGLGTPATRAATIENLIHRGYIERREKALWATDLGRTLIQHVHPSVKSAALTGEWEAKLRRIEARELSLESFTSEIESYVRETIALIRNSPAPAFTQSTSPGAINSGQGRQGATARGRFASEGRYEATASSSQSGNPGTMTSSSPVSYAAVPSHGGELIFTPGMRLKDALFKAFGHRDFRQHQEAICGEIIAGRDLLLVMPTGAGKSLCYQLPALVLPGCTIVVSPLIALMDDQVHKLQSLGVAAAALHSGLGRDESRAICRRYQDGTLKLLYVAPERLGLSGFLDFLARTPPSLIAIDEAHCISQWGHDFRPDYRMLAQRLLKLRPAPIVAMTATATPLVQKDIVDQLGLAKPSLHIHGFRRINIAIEISEVPLPDRAALAKKLLARESARPAIVYAPTRKETEAISDALASVGKVAPYHAGLSHERRQQIQKDFQAGALDVIVATIAFGMGIDKSDIRTVIHAALPSSVEAYYQEIGRAGRDGKFSRAILLHSYADHRTREFFIQKNYPDVKVLEGVMKKIPREGILRPALRTGLDASTLDNALEKLWVHGALEIDGDDEIRPLGAAWQKSYLNQQIHKEAEVSLMSSFAQNQQTCRMLLFLEHFGDEGDRETACGICDFCLPLGTLSKTFRAPNLEEQALMKAIVKMVAGQNRSLSVSKAFQQVNEAGLAKDRRVFDHAVDALNRQNIIACQTESFEKDGQTIHYRSLSTGSAARRPFEELDLLILDAPASEGSGSARKAKRTTAKKSRQGATRSPSLPSQSANGELPDLDDPLAQKLRGWRLRTAKKERVPAYRVFTDRTLSALVSVRPHSESELLNIDGIGKTKFDRYGSELLDLLSDF